MYNWKYSKKLHSQAEYVYNKKNIQHGKKEGKKKTHKILTFGTIKDTHVKSDLNLEK